jgi:hypothetical protein
MSAVATTSVLSTAAGIYDNNQQINAQKAAIAPLQGAQTDLYSKAENIANTPYTPYTGQQVAPITGSQQQAINQAQTDATNNEGGTDIANAEGLAGQIAGNGWSSATAAKYMNPYTSAVTAAAQKQLDQAYANTQNTAGLNAASQNAFGGDRAALTKAANTGEYELQSGTLAAQNNANAYNSAIQAWQADNQRASQAAQSYQQSGNDITQMNASQIKDLLATGGVAQATQQMQLNANYNNYLDQRNWSTTELQPLLSAAGNKSTPAGVTPSNTATDLLGMGSALAGYFGSSYSPTSGYDTAANSLDNQISEQGNATNLDNLGGLGNYQASIIAPGPN